MKGMTGIELIREAYPLRSVLEGKNNDLLRK